MFGADTNILVGRFFGWYNIYKGGSHWVGDIPQILGKGWKGKARGVVSHHHYFDRMVQITETGRERRIRMPYGMEKRRYVW